MRFFKIALLGMAAFTLVGCGGGSASSNPTSGATQASTPVSGGTQVSTPSSETTQGGDVVVKLPEKVKFATTFNASFEAESYKIGNEIMLVEGRSIAFVKIGANYDSCTMKMGENWSGEVEWNEESYPITLCEAFDNFYQGFIIEFLDPASYLSQYCTKLSGTKTVAGHNCVEYGSETMFGYQYWVEESSMLVYESTIGSQNYLVTECTNDFAGFPFEAPAM
ncbi:MAG: hypothetical protein MJ239_01495 [Bacilli bacterium]|nr:hypothetical protein [Bacilli bacterium]